ncbi:MAG: DNRLRE domain-containing protein [Bacteroidales bacterium]|nr:DNRLRE domain-containing protein [Bacteroidales bacterium]MBR4690065.1 DNRLRE domain-containing protein [Bacteroidales bacterium]
MKNFLNYLITIACLFAIPFVANAQRNKQNNTTQDETIIWRTGSYPFTEKKITKSQQKEKLDSLINYADYIVEGGAHKEVLTFNDENGEIWHIFELEIYNKIKGSIPENSIYFLWKDHTLYYDPLDKTHNYYKELHYSLIPSFIYFNDGIFFLHKSEISVDLMKPDTTVSNYAMYSYYDQSFSATENMPMIYEPIDLYQWGISYNEVEYYYGPYRMRINNNQWQLYDYLKEQCNLEIPGYSKTIEKKALLDSLVNDTIINDIQFKQKNIDIEQEEQFKTWLNGGRTIKRESLLKSANTVNSELSMDYQHLECTDTACYFVFDLNCKYKSNEIDTVYPDNILLYFEYNNLAFDTSIVSQGSLNLIGNYPFFDTAYYELEAVDHYLNKNQAAIRLSAKVFFSEENGIFQTYTHRRPIPVNEDFTICQIRIRVPTSSLKNSDIDYQKVGFKELWNHLELNFNFYSYTPENANSICLVDTISLALNDSYIMGKVDIHNVVPLNYDHFWSGGDCLMKISGKGFMERKRLSDFNIDPIIEMKNTDVHDGQYNYTYVPIDWTDIKLWTDTCIILNLPSIVYGKLGARNKNIGSGKIYIKNQVNKEGQYSNPIEIKYSILNTVSPISVMDSATNLFALQEKQIPYWARVNCSDQIQFEVHNSVSETYIENLQRAFNEWNNVLGFTFYSFKRDANGNIKRTSINDSYADSISIIYYDVTYTNALAGVSLPSITNKNYFDSCSYNQQSKYARREIDMFINNANMLYSSKNEQIHTFIHELGHGIGLGHVLNKGDNMYPTDTIKISSIKEGTRLGAEKIFEISDTVVWSCPNFENILSSETSICPPAAPSNITVKGVSKTRIQIEWAPDIKATSYTLRRSLNSNMSNAQTLTIPYNAKSYTDTSLTANTRYYYQVRANNANGYSAYSYVQSDKTKRISSNDSNNTLNVQNNGTTSISIQWEEETSTNDVQHYILERQEDFGQKSSSDFHIIAIVDANTLSYNDYDIEEGVTYNYRLSYTTDEDISQYSSIASVTPTEYDEHSMILPINRCVRLYKNEYSPYLNVENTNYNNYEYIRTWRWTHSGKPTYVRALFDIDISQIPSDAIIEYATLELKGVDHNTNLTEHNPSYKSNASWLELVTEYWDETQVTWNTQPASSSIYRVELENSSSRTQNYSVDITDLISRMISDTSVHGLMLRLKQEERYTRMTFASPFYSIDSLRPFVSIKYKTVPIRTMEAYPQKDASLYISGRPDQSDYEYTYWGDKEILICHAWTNYGKTFNTRSLIDFDLSEIPSNATIIDAKLDLHSPYPQTKELYKHYSYNIMHDSGYKSNESFLCKVTEPWGENSVSWHSQPSYDTTQNVLLPQSSAHFQDYLNIDVTHLIQNMVSQPDSAFGLMMVLRNENKYARMSFASSDFPDITRHPHLIVNYKVYPNSLLKSHDLSITSISKDYKSMKYLDVKTEQEFIDSTTTTNISITPNPSEGIFFINSDKPIQLVYIYNNTGSLMETKIVPDDRQKFLIDLSKYGCGTYIVKLQLRNGETIIRKLVVI